MKKLGFGLMRLPKKGVRTDLAQTKRMVDRFLEAGCTYFDTAFIYPGSEPAAKKALVDRHPRESFTLATKLNAGIPGITEAMAKKQFETSLERTGAGYFDYYLLHAMMESNEGKYARFGIWDYVAGLRDKGLVKHMGFSFHGGPRLLDQLLHDHPEVEFVQLQINYADWENPKVQSRANYEVARKHNKPIVVMEPVKGGKLADPPKEVKALMREADPDASPASWAIRFAASLEGVMTVLSGMSNMAQMEDNLSYMEDFTPLTSDQLLVLRRARELLGHSAVIPCTACGYCLEGCPKKIPIPEIFAAMNLRLGDGQTEQAVEAYDQAVKGGAARGAGSACEAGSASECIACGQCENACPQHINVIERLKDCAAALE